MIDLRIRAHTVTTAAGVGLAAMCESLWNRAIGLRINDLPWVNLDTWIGRVTELDDFQWKDVDCAWASRNNALAAIGLEQDNFFAELKHSIHQFGNNRIGVIVGTSTASIGRTELAYIESRDNQHLAARFQQPKVHNSHAPAAFVAHYTGLNGPVMTISTACSSSAKVFAAAERWLSIGIVDAVLVGGVDSLCLSVLNGFNSLELLSSLPCRPFDRRRDGINIGEAAGFALVVKADDLTADGIRFLGYGESSDAYHMSHPHPDGRGAEEAIRAALSRAGLLPSQIDYINLHGTATRANDTIEAGVIAKLFHPNTIASSTKGWTGHTLGAAGIVEALICIEALKANRIPGTMNLDEPDDDLSFPIQQTNLDISLKYVMSNSFGFGGNNCSLVFGLT